MIKTTLKIDGMACTMCESHVNDAVRKAADVSKVSSSFKKGITEIISPEPLDEKTLCESIEKTGYRVLSAATEPYEKKKLFGFLK